MLGLDGFVYPIEAEAAAENAFCFCSLEVLTVPVTRLWAKFWDVLFLYQSF